MTRLWNHVLILYVNVLKKLSILNVLYFIFRNEIKGLVKHLNAQKNVLKKRGIKVDGREYNLKFTGTIMLNSN